MSREWKTAGGVFQFICRNGWWFTGAHRSLIQNRVEMKKIGDKLQTQTVQALTGFHFMAYISFLQNGRGERVASEETRV